VKAWGRIVFALGIAAMVVAGCAGTAPPRCQGPKRPALAPRADLMKDLVSADGVRQARARQLLPYCGAEAVPDLLPLLSDPNPVVAKNAYYVVMDIANGSCTPGRKAERRQVTRLLMTLLRPEAETKLKLLGLRLLERTVPPDYPVTPVAALLKADDPMVREKARAALTRMNTGPALSALRAALGRSEPAFQCAILNGLAEARDRGSLQAVARMTENPDPGVRGAAAHALAWTGDPAYVPLLEKVISCADDATKTEAIDALLRLAQAIEGADAHKDAAKQIYTSLLDRTDGPLLEAALTGLGRTGDAEIAARMLRLLGSDDAAVRHAAIDAVRQIPGEDVTTRLLEAYWSARDEDRCVFLPALGARKDPRVVPPLAKAFESEDPVIRGAAYTALGESTRPEGIDALVAAGKKRPEDAASIQDNLLGLADTIKGAENASRAMEAYKAAFELGTDTDTRLKALRGLAAYPSKESLDVAVKAAADENLKGAVPDVLVGVAAAFQAAGDAQQARNVLDVLMRVDASIQRLQSFAERARALGGQVDLSSMLGPIRKWRIVGPFKVRELAADWGTDFVHEKNINLKETFVRDGQTLAWKAVEGAGDLGSVDLVTSLAACATCFAYAYTEIEVPEKQTVMLRLGSDDGIVAWVNGAKVHDHPVDRGMAPDQDLVTVRLDSGINKILLKISQGGGGWGFCARITDRDGHAVSFKQQ
jgi:HEAT repeat protein